MTTTTLDALAKLRGEAACKYAGESDPSPSFETWRRTAFKLFGLDGWTPERPAPLAPAAPAPADNGSGLSGFFRQMGVRTPAALVCAELAPRGVIVTDLESAASRWPDLILPRLSGVLPEDYRKLGLANAAGWRGGAFVYVPKGVRAEAPIRLTFEPEGDYFFPRVLAIVEAGAEASIVEEHVSSAGDTGTSVGASTLVAGEGARVQYFYTQELGRRKSFWTQKASLGAGAQLTHTSVALGGELHKSWLDVEMGGRGARSELYGILLGRGTQHFDSHTYQHALAESTYSDLLFRAALKDKARSIYTGLIRIEPQAKDTDAYQANHNLLLSGTARADSTPILEILTDAVRCKHGATAGPLSKDELFYLSARGIPEAEAQKMLILGFFEPVLKRLPLGAARERLERRIEEAL